MAKQMNKKSGFRRLFIGLAFVILSLVVANILSNLAGFNDHMNKFSSYLNNQDRQGAEKELNSLKVYYNYFARWKLRYFADRYLLPDMFLYEAAVLNLREEWEKVELNLENHQNDYRAGYLTGVAKFKSLKVGYNSEEAKKDQKVRANIVQMVLDQVKPYFEKCVKEGPGPEENFNCSYNYDLVSDPESVQKALQSQMPGPEFVLGRREGNRPDDGGSGEKRLPDSSAGEGQPKRGG